MDIATFIPSLSMDHLDCFLFGAIIDKASVSIHVEVFL
jgi:hypothetical protein